MLLNSPHKQNLAQLYVLCSKQSLKNRCHTLHTFVRNLRDNGLGLTQRQILSPMDREVWVKSCFESQPRLLRMFGSNNYLGLANHPYVKEKVIEAIHTYGTGIAGPPLLNGSNSLLLSLEERLAHLKGMESAAVFSSGFGANLGLMSTIPSAKDLVLYDQSHHSSCIDGLKASKGKYQAFKHNNVSDLRDKLEKSQARDLFIAVEGVYSMSGDVAPIPDITKLCNEFDAHLIIDDAHGTGVMGNKGAGTADHFFMKQQVAIAMGTFSKSFASTGGFVAGDKELIEYLRYYAHPYMFSAALTPPVLAAVHAGLDLLEKDDSLIEQLWYNIRYTQKSLKKIGIHIPAQSAILALPCPKHLDIRETALLFHKKGIFLNSIEYPAVPKGQEFFRISINANQTEEDIHFLIDSIEQIYHLKDQQVG